MIFILDYRLNTFITLCKLLNYSKTAEALHITQPAVSQHIKHLEDSYNVKLFNYSSRTLSLTDEGKLLYSFALAMKTSSDKVRSILQAPKTKKVPLKFATTLTIGEYTMNTILEKLLVDYPDIHISMSVGNTEDLLNKLREGHIDFAVLEGNFDKSQYEYRLFSLENYIGICSPQHHFNNRLVNFEEIFKERLLLREKGSGSRNIFEQILYEYSFTMNNFREFVEIGNIGTIKTLTQSNMGISFIYEEAVRHELDNKSLSKIYLKDFDIKREFNFVFLKDSLHEREYLTWYDYFISAYSR